MKTALIFPGQGSQFVGMGHDFYLKYKVSQDIYNRLDSTLERKLSDLIFFGEENDLSKTQNAQPAIMATSVSIYNALIYENLITENSYCCVAGHSLGEYSALVVNKCLKFEDSVNLLKIRSKAMQESMPFGSGGMVALIGCSENNVSQLIDKAFSYGKVFIANDNGDGQVVLSGEIAAIEYILNNSKELNIKRAIPLSVSAPFHCNLMDPASKIMSNEINKFKFNTFSVPLYSNVTSEECTEHDIVNLLVTQIVSKVRWREIIKNMLRDNIENIIEIGPGKVLTNLVKRASKNVNAISISKLEDFDKLDNINI